jgi:acetolactate synthase-1/2/3 large subunit
VGGGAMYLNHALGRHPGLRVSYNHHEQACAIAAEAYARLCNRIAAVCVTSGPGGTNALTGVLCGYMGSIPMLIVSGQVRIPFTVHGSGLRVRTLGEQEFDIVRVAKPMTKYCVMVEEPADVRYHLEKAIYLAHAGRPGPVWLDLPLDVQNAVIESDELEGYVPVPADADLPSDVIDEVIWDAILEKLNRAKRPVVFCGLGIRLAGAYEDFLHLIELLNIPVVTGMSTVDYLPNDHRLYAGRSGSTGDRAGNFAVQNADVLLSIGSRLSLKQTGYNTKTWAAKAFKIMVDVDRGELEKPYLGIDLPVWSNAGVFIKTLIQLAERVHLQPELEAWRERCRGWVQRYPVVLPKHYQTDDGKANVYAFYNELSAVMREGDILVATSGSSRVVGRQALSLKKSQRFIVNHPTSPMGYCLPAAFGACLANRSQPTFLCTGEGGIQMNLQELQTIRHHNLPIRIMVINNDGYHSIRMTQRAFFPGQGHVGIGKDSGDLSFPSLKMIAEAYGIPYLCCPSNAQLRPTLVLIYEHKGPVICEVICTTRQGVEPKASSRRNDQGALVSAPLEDMSPFLGREELMANMLD